MSCRRLRSLLLPLLGLGVLACARESGDQVSVVNTDGGTRVTINGQTFHLKETDKETLRQSFKAATPRVVVDVFSGQIAIEAGPDGTVDVEVTRTAIGETKEEAKSHLQLIDVQMKQEGETIRITARRTDDGKKAAERDVAELKKQYAVRGADAVVKVPAGAAVDLKTAFGDVRVVGLAGHVEAATSSGGIKVSGGKGEVKLTSSFGDLTVDGANTVVNATTRSGSVTAKGAKGPLELSSGFGAVAVDGAAEKVTVKTNSGEVNVKATGPVELKSDFGAITVVGAATVKAETRSGNVTVKGANGLVTAKSGFGALDVDQAPAGATLETSSGDIHLKGGKGPITLTTSFGRIDADVANATVRAVSRSGDVQIAGSLAEGEHVLNSGFGKITLTLPADSQFRLDAETKFGQVRSAFALTPSGPKNEKHLRGSVGDNPKIVLKLTTSSGDVDVRKK